MFCSEAELGKSHADIRLEPLVARYSHLRHGYLSDRAQVPQASEGASARVAAAVDETAGQLRRHLADERLTRQYPAVRFFLGRARRYRA